MYYQTSAGILHIQISDEKITQAVFIKQAFAKTMPVQNINQNKLALNGTPFQIKVWRETLKIPAGQTKTYQEIAIAIGHPKAYRAVANALGANKIAYFIPCHRVIRNDGSLGGYKWGNEKKIALLKSEGIKKAHQI